MEVEELFFSGRGGYHDGAARAWRLWWRERGRSRDGCMGDVGGELLVPHFYSQKRKRRLQTYKVRTREAIVIRRKIIIDAMLDELQLPKSTSEIVINTHGTVIVTIVFFPSTKSLHQSFRP